MAAIQMKWRKVSKTLFYWLMSLVWNTCTCKFIKRCTRQSNFFGQEIDTASVIKHFSLPVLIACLSYSILFYCVLIGFYSALFFFMVSRWPRLSPRFQVAHQCRQLVDRELNNQLWSSFGFIFLLFLWK